MKTLVTIFLATFLAGSYQSERKTRLIFEESKSMRSSFCMYSDGRFYEARSSGCTGQTFAAGSWEASNDTVTLRYQAVDVFKFDVLKSKDTSGRWQIIRVVDCYDQPVRFQDFYYDTVSQNLYNPGILRLSKGKMVWYANPLFDQHDEGEESHFSNADTIIYKWRCNRESIESISGGDLFIQSDTFSKKIRFQNKRVVELPER